MYIVLRISGERARKRNEWCGRVDGLERGRAVDFCVIFVDVLSPKDLHLRRLRRRARESCCPWKRTWEVSQCLEVAGTAGVVGTGDFMGSFGRSAQSNQPGAILRAELHVA